MSKRVSARSKIDALQLKVLQVLWSKKEASVLEIQRELAKEKELAITTIGTVLRRLDKKGFVTYRKEGRQYIYKALVSEEASRSHVIRDLIHNWFRGKPSALVSHLIHSTDIADADLEALKRMVEQARDKDNT